MQLYVSLLLGEEITYYYKKYLNNESRNPSLCKFFMKFWRKSQSGSVLPCDVNGPQSSDVRGWPEADGHLPRPRNGIHLKPKLHLLHYLNGIISFKWIFNSLQDTLYFSLGDQLMPRCLVEEVSLPENRDFFTTTATYIQYFHWKTAPWWVLRMGMEKSLKVYLCS